MTVTKPEMIAALQLHLNDDPRAPDAMAEILERLVDGERRGQTARPEQQSEPAPYLKAMTVPDLLVEARRLGLVMHNRGAGGLWCREPNGSRAVFYGSGRQQRSTTQRSALGRAPSKGSTFKTYLAHYVTDNRKAADNG